jgi:hypothetical protein
VTSAHQILAQRLTRAHQIARCLLGDARDVDRAQRPGHQQAHQQLGVALIGLDAIRRRAWRLARRDNDHLDPLHRGRAREPKPSRTRLVHRPHRPPQ